MQLLKSELPFKLTLTYKKTGKKYVYYKSTTEIIFYDDKLFDVKKEEKKRYE